MKTGTMVMIGAVAVAAVGGIGYYLWSKGKQVAGGTDQAASAYGPASIPDPSYRRRARPVYSVAVPTGMKTTF